jgi:hypothetical protein
MFDNYTYDTVIDDHMLEEIMNNFETVHSNNNDTIRISEIKQIYGLTSKDLEGVSYTTQCNPVYKNSHPMVLYNSEIIEKIFNENVTWGWNMLLQLLDS